MSRCKVCGHWSVGFFKHSFYCPVLDKKNPHITAKEEREDPCQCNYCNRHRKINKLKQIGLDQVFEQVRLDAFQKETR